MNMASTPTQHPLFQPSHKYANMLSCIYTCFRESGYHQKERERQRLDFVKACRHHSPHDLPFPRPSQPTTRVRSMCPFAAAFSPLEAIGIKNIHFWIPPAIFVLHHKLLEKPRSLPPPRGKKKRREPTSKDRNFGLDIVWCYC
jgi:hypothetical protein